MTGNRIGIQGFVMFGVCLVLAGGAALGDGEYYTNVAPGAGVAQSGSGNSAEWLDYDNDGDLDLYVVNYATSGGFYRNRLVETGTATFESVSVGVSGNGEAVVPEDYDKDGWVDVLLATIAGPILYRNNTVGGFTNVTASAGITATGNGLPVWGDYNHDTYPDLYIGYAVKKLYVNNGNGTFTDTTALLPPVAAASVTPAWIDYDGDGYADLFLATNSGNMLLYHYNPVSGAFEDVSAAAKIDLPGGANCRLAVGDYNGDGNLDIYVGRSGTSNYLFRNEGNGTFTEVAHQAGVRDTAGNGNTDVVFLDFDLDGDLDLYTNGGRYGSNNFFRNRGNGTFEDITALTGLSNTDDTHDIAVGDFDGDGFPDIYEVNFTGYGSSANKLFQFQNNIPAPPTPGDLNGDGNADNMDITPFTFALTYPEAVFEAMYPDGLYWAGDINEDGNVDNLDITPFVDLLLGGGQAIPEPAALFVMAAAGLPVLLRRRRRRSRNPELASACRELVEPGLALGEAALLRSAAADSAQVIRRRRK